MGTQGERRPRGTDRKEALKTGALLNAGVLLLSAGVYFFKLPNGFTTGGVSGIGILLGNLNTPLSPAVWILIINLLLLGAGFLFLGKGTGFKTVCCSVAFSLELWLFERLFPMSAPLTDQPFLELTFAILLTAFGSAVLFSRSASSGGTDIIALLLKKYTHMDVGRALLYTDFLITASAFLVFDVKTGLFSLLGLFVKAFLVDSVIDSFHSCKYFIVITEKKDEIREYILRTLHHGVTTTEATGEFTQAPKVMIHTVCKRIEAIRLKRRIRELDPQAFLIVTTTSEIIGRGFRSV